MRSYPWVPTTTRERDAAAMCQHLEHPVGRPVHDVHAAAVQDRPLVASGGQRGDFAGIVDDEARCRQRVLGGPVQLFGRDGRGRDKGQGDGRRPPES